MAEPRSGQLQSQETKAADLPLTDFVSSHEPPSASVGLTGQGNRMVRVL